MSVSREPKAALDFDAVLALLQSWLGVDAILLAESDELPLPPSLARGALTTAPDIAEPFDPGAFGFLVGEAGFSLHRRYFAGATNYPGADHLEITLDRRSENGIAVTINVLRVRACPSPY